MTVSTRQTFCRMCERGLGAHIATLSMRGGQRTLASSSWPRTQTGSKIRNSRLDTNATSLRRTSSFNPHGSPPMFQGEDYSVLRGKYIRRIYLITGRDSWLWVVSAFIPAHQYNGMTDTREAANLPAPWYTSAIENDSPIVRKVCHGGTRTLETQHQLEPIRSRPHLIRNVEWPHRACGAVSRL